MQWDCPQDKLAKNAEKTKKREKNREKAKGNQANPAKKGFKSTELKRGAWKLCWYQTNT